MKERNVNYDAVKGTAIILVAMFHSIMKQTECPQILQSISCFPAVLFILISGFFSYGKKDTDAKWLVSRAKLLLVPYFAWVVIDIFAKSRFSVGEIIDIVVDALLHPEMHLWFLYILFVLCGVLYISNMFIKKLNIEKYDYFVYAGFIVFANVMFWVFHIQILGMYLLSLHSVFFFIGYLSRKYNVYEKYNNIFRSKIFKAILMILAFILVPMYRKMSTPIYEIYFNKVISSFTLQTIFSIFMTYLVGILGSYATTEIVCVLPMFIRNKLAFLGTISVELYIIHFWFFFDFSNYWYIDIILKTAATLTISTVLVLAVERGRLGELIFGRRK